MHLTYHDDERTGDADRPAVEIAKRVRDFLKKDPHAMVIGDLNDLGIDGSFDLVQLGEDLWAYILHESEFINVAECIKTDGQNR